MGARKEVMGAVVWNSGNYSDCPCAFWMEGGASCLTELQVRDEIHRGRVQVIWRGEICIQQILGERFIYLLNSSFVIIVKNLIFNVRFQWP